MKKQPPKAVMLNDSLRIEFMYGENDILLYRQVRVYTHIDDSVGPWEMVTAFRPDYLHNEHLHPESPLVSSWCEQYDEAEPICPYCNHKQEDYYHEMGEIGSTFDTKCEACNEPFRCTTSFPSGFTSVPIPCPERNQAHRFITEGQYYYKGKAIRSVSCVKCRENDFNATGKRVEGPLLPFYEGYNNPNFFDPEGILKVDGVYDKPTPVLDALRNPWKHNLEMALMTHDRIYNADSES